MIINLNNEGHFYRGIGDLITLSWLAEAAKTTDDPSRFFLTDEYYKFLLTDFLHQELVADRRGSVVLDNAYTAELADGGRENRLFYVNKELHRDLIPKNPPLGPFPSVNPTENPSRSVLLFPKVSHFIRAWPWVYWLELYHYLKAANYSPLMVFEHSEAISGIDYIANKDIPAIAALISRAALVVTNDSFPLHLAGTLNIPCLALLGPSTANLFSYMPSVISLTSSKSCTGCMYHPPHCQPYCRQGCRSLMLLSPESVFSKAKEYLS